MVDIASILASQQMNIPQQRLTQADVPFVWGQGGRRMTPEQVAAERARALELGAGDYSPVGHWAQGLGRIADGLESGFARRDANRAADVNAAETDAVLKALMEGSPNQQTTIAAATNPYVTDQVRTIAQSLMPKRAQPTDLQRNYEYLKSIGREADADALLLKETDPTKSSTFVDPDTGQLMAIRYDPRDLRGGGPASGPAMPEWWSVYSPEEQGVIQRNAERQLAARNIPNGSPAAGGPQVGTVVDGYRFKGGNPNDKNSWEQTR